MARIGKTVSHAMTLKQAGDKPDCSIITLDKDNYDSLYHDAMNYANIVFDNKQLRDEFIRFAKNNNYDYKAWKEVPDYEFFVIGKIAWVANNGGELKQCSIDYINNKIKSFKQNVAEVVEELTISTQEKNRRSFNHIYSVIDDALVERTYTSELSKELVKKLNPPQYILNDVANKFAEKLDEVMSDDPEINEGYKWMKAAEKKKYITMLETIIGDLKSTQQKVFKNRGRPRKVKSADKITSSVKFKNSDKDLDIVSVSPTKIIGANTAIIYDTKKRKATILVSDSGLSIKGTTIQNFNPTKSVMKSLRAGREKDIINQLKANKRQASKAFTDIKSKAYTGEDISGRLNDTTLIIGTW